MRVYTLNKKGKIHDCHTEDHLLVRDLNEPWMVAAVMDGCSSGIDSHFASGLFVKIINRICRELIMKKGSPALNNAKENKPEMTGRNILKEVWDTLKTVKNTLSLQTHELLSTLILVVYNQSNRSAWINVSGDGYIAIDENIREFDQQNMPDYMAYHLEEGFDRWIDSHSQSFSIHSADNLAISTDGVSKFYSLSQRSPLRIDPVNYLLVDKEFAGSPKMLEDKFKILATDHGLYPFDDLGIVRIINAPGRQ